MQLISRFKGASIEWSPVIRQIAEKVKVSVPTVSSKINSMESMGVIKGYQAELDSEKLGGISVVLDIKTRPADIRKVSDRFAGDEHVRKAYILSNSRILIVVTFTQQHLINEFVMTLSDIPEIVEYGSPTSSPSSKRTKGRSSTPRSMWS